MPMPYDGLDIGLALSASSRTWDFQYERIDALGAVLGPVEFESARVTHSALADKVKRTISGTIAPDSTFDFLVDRLRVIAALKMPDGFWQRFPVGVFLLSSNETTRGKGAPRSTRPVVGYDLLQILVEDCVTDRYVVNAGTNYVTAAQTVLLDAGFLFLLIASSPLTLPAPMEWPPGTPKLKIVNDLLAAINFTSLSMTALGHPTAGPYLDPSEAPVLWSYALDSASLVTPGTITSLDLFNVPNKIVGVISEADRVPLVASATNSDPLSPISTVRRGRTIVRQLDSTEINGAADLTTLQAKVNRALAEAGRQYETVTFETGLMPVHEDADVITFDYGEGPQLYRETGWEMELRHGARMRHTARRSVVVG